MGVSVSSFEYAPTPAPTPTPAPAPAPTSAPVPTPAPTPTYDANCYIHRGCMGGAGYSTNPFGTDSMGAGWYCLDGQSVNSATRFDACEIHTGCSAVHYDRRSQVWRCNA